MTDAEDWDAVVLKWLDEHTEYPLDGVEVRLLHMQVKIFQCVAGDNYGDPAVLDKAHAIVQAILAGAGADTLKQVLR